MKPEPETIVLWINACFPIRKKEILCALDQVGISKKRGLSRKSKVFNWD